MTDEGRARPAYVRQFTAKVAAVLAEEHARDPMGELMVWLQIALRREASVGEIYGVSNLEGRLDQLQAPQEIVNLLRMTICNIWAQEKAHAAYLEAVLMAVARPSSTLWQRLHARLEGFMGAMEGHVMSGRTSPNHLQRVKAGLMLTIGRHVQDVPEFVSSLSALSFHEFCVLNSELEITAVHGYQRMLTLLHQIGNRTRVPTDTTLGVDIARMVRDERFHNEAFRAIEDWFAPSRPDLSNGNSIRIGVSLAACASRLAAIRADIYGCEPGADAGNEFLAPPDAAVEGG